MGPLSNYYALVEKVDVLCGRIAEEFADHITCAKGCDGCCRHISVFPVEGAALAAALAALAPEERARVRENAATAPEAHCPLLAAGICLLYEARPLICRTQGMPLLLREESGKRIDFCPENFRGVGSLPGNAVVDLETLNTLLAGVNRLFVGDDAGEWPERVTIREALLRGGQ
jgi:uncharacterized protein